MIFNSTFNAIETVGRMNNKRILKEKMAKFETVLMIIPSLFSTFFCYLSIRDADITSFSYFFLFLLLIVTHGHRGLFG